MTRRKLLRAALLACAALAARGADARPGGGSSFRSSGSSSRSSSSSSSSRSSGSSYRSSGSSGSSSYTGWSGSSGSVSTGGGGGGLSFFTGALSAIPGVIGFWLMSRLGAAITSRASGRPAPIHAGSAGRALLGVPLVAVAMLVFVFLDWPGRIAMQVILGFTVVLLAQSGRPVAMDAIGAPPAYDPNIDRAIGLLRAKDPGFSRVAFLDFVQALYADLHGRTGTPAFGTMRAFVADAVLGSFANAMGSARLDAVVVGLLAIESVRVTDDLTAIDVTIESNYTRHDPNAAPARWVVHESWTLTRATVAQSPPPAQMRVLSCASCGAPADFTDAGACRYCGALVRRGETQWQLTTRFVQHAEAFSTTGLGETAPEAGTAFQTMFHPALTAQKADFAAAHGEAWADFERRFLGETVAPVFVQMYAAWSKKTWNDVRHLLGDRLWSSQRFWITAYDEQGLTNKLEDILVRNIEVVRIERDQWFECITVRVHAQCRDFTVDAKGRPVGGDPKKVRQFSEYWTLVRGAGAKPPARGWSDRACPSCGAPADRMGEAGVCGYCSVKVTTGDFGWVLTLITQDEVYRG